MLPVFIVLEQASPTRRQMLDGSAVFLSRIDRIYIKGCPAELSGVSVGVAAVGDALWPDNPSDHIPVVARLSPRRARPPSTHPPLAAALCRSEVFVRATSEMARFIPDSMAPVAQIEAYKAVFRKAALCASRAMGEQRRLPAAILAQTAHGVLRSSHRGDGTGVAGEVRANRDLEACRPSSVSVGRPWSIPWGCLTTSGARALTRRGKRAAT